MGKLSTEKKMYSTVGQWHCQPPMGCGSLGLQDKLIPDTIRSGRKSLLCKAWLSWLWHESVQFLVPDSRHLHTFKAAAVMRPRTPLNPSCFTIGPIVSQICSAVSAISSAIETSGMQSWWVPRAQDSQTQCGLPWPPSPPPSKPNRSQGEAIPSCR